MTRDEKKLVNESIIEALFAALFVKANTDAAATFTKLGYLKEADNMISAVEGDLGWLITELRATGLDLKVDSVDLD